MIVRMLFLLFCFTTVSSLAQQNAYKNIVNELSASLNQSIVNRAGDYGKYGAGIGVYHVFNDSGWIQPLVGLEYNYSSQFNAYATESHFTYAQDMTYQLHYFSIPLVCRFILGKKYKLFFDPGVYLDNDIKVRRTGFLYNNFELNSKKVNENVSANRVFGFQIGLGTGITFRKKTLFVKCDIKFPFGESAGNYESINNFYWRISLGIHF